MASFVAGMVIPYYNHLMDILNTDPNLRKTAKGIFTQMGYAAGGAAIGGVTGGPAGALLGSIIGSVYGYCQVENYDSLLCVLNNLNEVEKQNLVNKVQELVGSSSLEALAGFVASNVNRELLMKLLRDFTKSQAKGA